MLIDVPHHIEVIMENKVKDLLKDKDVDVITSNLKDYYIY